MDPAASEDRRRRRLIIAAIAAGLTLLLLVGVGVYGLLRGHAPTTAPTPSERASETSSTGADPTPGASPAPIPQNVGPEAFARAVAQALFAWDTASGNSPSDYAQVLADVAHGSEVDALVGDVRAYLPTAEAWTQLRTYATTQWITIDEVVVPQAWETAVSQAAPGQIPDGATAYTITGTRHREGTWGTEPVEASRPVAFTVFLVCTPEASARGAGTRSCEVLRLSQLDNPLR
ncbi:hypothetical protein PFZ49_02305 [Microbacterium lacticum]|uniref:hypothetical protein n=1 Tax=Microbacterium lacticum TaxID=33885 RepID=UPI003A85F310